jgi:hypothetical protein
MVNLIDDPCRCLTVVTFQNRRDGKDLRPLLEQSDKAREKWAQCRGCSRHFSFGKQAGTSATLNLKSKRPITPFGKPCKLKKGLAIFMETTLPGRHQPPADHRYQLGDVVRVEARFKFVLDSSNTSIAMPPSILFSVS